MKNCRSRARKAKFYEEFPEQSPQSQIYEELPDQSLHSQNFMKSCRSRARKAKILWRVAGAEPAKPKFYEELPEQSPQGQNFIKSCRSRARKAKFRWRVAGSVSSRRIKSEYDNKGSVRNQLELRLRLPSHPQSELLFNHPQVHPFRQMPT